MPFLFVYVCDLLDELERPHLQDVPLLPPVLKARTMELVMRWLKRHKKDLGDFNTCSHAAISMLRPDFRTDHDYDLDAESLELVIARVLRLSREDYVKLHRWQTHPHLCDLGSCVETVRGGLSGVSGHHRSQEMRPFCDTIIPVAHMTPITFHEPPF